jgi:hypothetical protein
MLVGTSTLHTPNRDTCRQAGNGMVGIAEMKHNGPSRCGQEHQHVAFVR